MYMSVVLHRYHLGRCSKLWPIKRWWSGCREGSQNAVIVHQNKSPCGFESGGSFAWERTNNATKDGLQVGFHPWLDYRILIKLDFMSFYISIVCMVILASCADLPFPLFCFCDRSHCSCCCLFCSCCDEAGKSSIMDMEGETLLHSVTSVTGLHMLS